MAQNDLAKCQTGASNILKAAAQYNVPPALLGMCFFWLFVFVLETEE
jgi:hypothetical protein